MKKIQLTQGKYALVDDADYSWLSDFKWHAIKSYSTFYVRRNESLGGGQYKKIHMHSYILQPDIGLEVDHINGNGLDNRRCNLRLATRYQNMRNVIKKTGNYTSVFKGVYWHSTLSRWAAAISFCGERHYLGSFNTETEAAIAYNNAAIQLDPVFIPLNEIIPWEPKK